MNIESAADSLEKHLGLIPAQGQVADGGNCLFVCLYDKTSDLDTGLKEWQGFPVKWRLDMQPSFIVG